MSSSENPNPSSSSTQPSQPPRPISPPDGQILCRWKGCGKVFEAAETIYKHLCEDHVGRKSTGNLCLKCEWEGCDAASSAKRHHITSHLIVHTPFKPHSCSICNKTFKRPQDLKKHVRIHDTSTRPKASAPVEEAPKEFYPHPLPAYNDMQHLQPSAMYTNHHHGHPGLAPQHQPAYPQVSYPQVKREHTPNYGDASSSASLSPLSSHLGTPASSNSPSVYPNQYNRNNGGYNSPYHPAQYTTSHQQQLQFQQQQQQQQLYQMNSRSYIGMVPPSTTMKQEITPQHQPHPNDAYSYLGQGTHHAGSKRGYEAMLVGDFAEDVRKKRITANYNEDMAARLNSISHYSHVIPDSTISSLFGGVAPWNLNGEHAAAMADNHRTADIAQLNTFLLQLGANVARNNEKKEEASNSSSASSSSHSQPALSPNSHSSASSHAASPPDSSSSSATSFVDQKDIQFDLSGLDGIHGFDESLLHGVNWSSNNHESDDFYHQQSFSSLSSRPIAHLPSRSAQHSGGQPAMSNQNQYGSSYTHSSYPQSGFGGLGHGQSTSFDSLRSSRGPTLVPQLAQLDSVNHNYRKVEALQRAAPMVGSRNSTTLPSLSSKMATNNQGQDDEEMEEMDSKSIRLPPLESSTSYRQRSPSPAVSDASSTTTRTSNSASSSPLTHGIYPKVISHGNPSRKLPPMTASSDRSGPSISSILASSSDPLSSSHQRSSSYAARNAAQSHMRSSNSYRFRSQSEDNASDDTGASTPLDSHRSRSGSYSSEAPAISASSKIYPALPPSASEDNMDVDEVHSEMSNLALANSKVVMDKETRRRHLDLIRRLLIAINFPQQQEKGNPEQDSGSDSSIERDLPPMKIDSKTGKDVEPLPGIDQLFKSAGHRHRLSNARSQPHQGFERLPSFKNLQQGNERERSSITDGRMDGVDV